MSDVKEVFGSATSITITLNSLASSSTAGREATAIDNSTTLYLDALVQFVLATGSGTIGSTPYAFIYAIASADGGTTWPDPATGSDAAITVGGQVKGGILDVVSLPAASTTYKSQPRSVASIFGGVLPPKWSIVVLNSCGVALASAGNSGKFVPVYGSVA